MKRFIEGRDRAVHAGHAVLVAGDRDDLHGRILLQEPDSLQVDIAHRVRARSIEDPEALS